MNSISGSTRPALTQSAFPISVVPKMSGPQDLVDISNEQKTGEGDSVECGSAGVIGAGVGAAAGGIGGAAVGAWFGASNGSAGGAIGALAGGAAGAIVGAVIVGKYAHNRGKKNA